MNKFFDYLRQKHNINFTPEQRKAIIHKDGPAVVFAVPGSGKTTVSVCRCAYLAGKYGVDPKNILSITFSKASALDMQHRIRQLFGDGEATKVTFSTIHGFAYRIVRDYCYKAGKKYILIEDEDARVSKTKLLKRIFYEVNGEYASDDKIEELVNAIGLVANKMIPAKSALDTGIRNFADIYERYQKFKSVHGYIDFDDMLTKCYEILKTEPGILSKYRQMYKYVQVDEGQDTSKIQYSIIGLLVHPNNNLFIVADDDQSIYGFRGAEPGDLLKIQLTYPDAKKFIMDENFRSTGSIVSAANEFIRSNVHRQSKNLHTNNEKGSPIKIVNLSNERDQVKYIVDNVKTMKGTSDCAVLYRYNVSAIAVADQLERCGVEFYIKDFRKNHFNHWVVGDIVSFFCLSLNPGDTESFGNIYFKLNCYLSKKMLEFVMNANNRSTVFEKLLRYPGLNDMQIRRIKRLAEKFDNLKSLKPYEGINYIEGQMEYGEYLKEYCNNSSESITSVNLMLSNLKSIASGENTIVGFLDRLYNLQEIMNASGKNRNKASVTLSTIHSAKGLEFERVYMIDLIDGQFPTQSSINSFERGNDMDLEEERRLFYVGMTRAKKVLELITIDSRDGSSTAKSRFVAEVERMGLGVKKHNKKADRDPNSVDYNALSKGFRLRHKRFGEGKVIAINRRDDMIEIDFDNYGSRALSLSTCEENNLLLYTTQ